MGHDGIMFFMGENRIGINRRVFSLARSLAFGMRHRGGGRKSNAANVKAVRSFISHQRIRVFLLSLKGYFVIPW